MSIAPRTMKKPSTTKKTRRMPWAPLVCGLVLVLVIVCVATGSLLAPQDPTVQHPLLGVVGPGHGHPLGTDQLGHDVLSRLIAGARAAVLGPLIVAAGCLVIGAFLGIAAAYFGGLLDTMINRFADLIYSLPAVLIALVVVGVAGGGYWLTVGVLLLLSLPYEIRLCRSAAMVQVRLPYVEATRTLGISWRRTLFRHVVPNISPTLIATFLLDFVSALVGFAALSYLGLGVSVGAPSWGKMLAQGQPLIAENPWLSVAPAVLLILTGASATLLGDWAHERLSRTGDRT